MAADGANSKAEIAEALDRSLRKACRSAEKAARGYNRQRVQWLRLAMEESAKAQCWTSFRSLQNRLDGLWADEDMEDAEVMELNRTYGL